MITLDTVFAACIHKNSSTDDICGKENFRVFDGAVNVTLCCEVYNHIRVFFFKEFVNCFAICDAFFYETEIWVVHDRCKSGKVSCIGQTVQTDDAVIRVFF